MNDTETKFIENIIKEGIKEERDWLDILESVRLINRDLADMKQSSEKMDEAKNILTEL